MARLPIKLIRSMRNAGLTVHEYPNWQHRGYDTFTPRAVVCHATGGSKTSTDAGEKRTLWVAGSATAPAPIAQFYLSRSGEWTIGASGRCNHIGNADLPYQDVAGNQYAIGIEAQHSPEEDWTERQYLSYVFGVSAICSFYGWNIRHVYGHYEISYTGKTDPYFSMKKFRALVDAGIKGVTEMALKDEMIKATEWARERWPEIPAEGMPASTYVMHDYVYSRYAQELIKEYGEQVLTRLTAIDSKLAELASKSGDPATYDTVRKAIRDHLDDDSAT